MNKKRKQEKGITLIALVITIIVLLILAGVTIAMLTGENGILNKATTAKERTVAADENEKVSLAYNDVLADKLDGTSSGDITVAEMESALERQGLDDTKVLVEKINGEDKIKITFTDTNNEYEVDTEVGIGTTSTTPTTPTTPTSSTPSEDYLALREGDKVVYTYNGTQIPCTVLYDSTNANYSTYGVQIIADDTVGTVELGNGTGSSSTDATDFATAKDSYNDAIGILNTATASYLNTDLATDARCVGSVPDNKNSKNTAKYSNSYNYFSSYNNQFEAGNGYTPNYTVDRAKMDELNITNISKNYWLASREFSADSSSTYFRVCFVSSNGYLRRSDLCYVGVGGNINSNSDAYGLRPVFTLKSDIKVVDGENNTKVLTK